MSIFNLLSSSNNTTKKILKDTKNDIGWMGVIDKAFKDDNGIFIYLHGHYYNLEKFQILGVKMEITRKYTDEDPWGEEDWENESVSSVLDPYGEENWNEDDEYPSKGDTVVCVKKLGEFKWGDLYDVTEVSGQGVYLYMPLNRRTYRINKKFFHTYFKKLE